MRYRPFGRSGVVTSAVTLVIGDEYARRGQQHCAQMVQAALDHGINAFHIDTPAPDCAIALGQVLSTIERRLVFVSLRLGLGRGRTGLVRDFSPQALTHAVQQTLQVSGLGHLDLVILDDPGEEELPRASLEALKSLRSAGALSLLGVAGVDDAMDAYLSTGQFDVLATPYSITSGWKERNRMRTAVEQDMAIVAYDWYPEQFSSPRKIQKAEQPKRGLFSRVFQEPEPLQGMGGYGFLHRTNGWTAEDICLGYTLTEPAVSSAWIVAPEMDDLDRLAAVPDRDLPPGLGAQIEMARFSRVDSESA